MGHSAGGAFTQILLDHGFGAAGVAINSAPTEGVKRSCRCRRSRRPSRCSRTRPTATAPSASRTSSGTTRSRTRFSEEESRALYERYHIPASGAIFWGSALANIHPGHDDTLGRLQERRPRAAAVHLRQRGPPHAADDPAVERQALQVRTRSPRSRSSRAPHLLPAQEGWEEVADYALDWALEHAGAGAPRAPRERRPPHPHRRADGPDRGRRLAAADRPDVRPPGRQVPLRLGDGVAQARRAGDRRRRPRADRRGAAQPRPPRRQPRRRRARAAPVGRRRRHDGVRRAAARRRRARARAVGRPRGSRRPDRPAIEITATPCRHGPPLQPPDRRRRDRLRAALGRPGARRAVDLGRHRALRRRARGREPAARSTPRCCTSAACASRSPGRCATR